MSIKLAGYRRFTDTTGKKRQSGPDGRLTRRVWSRGAVAGVRGHLNIYTHTQLSESAAWYEMKRALVSEEEEQDEASLHLCSELPSPAL